MRVLGIDPGFERLGVALLEKLPGQKESVLFSECFKTKTGIDFEERLRLLGEETRKVIAEFKPNILAIETLFLSNNQKTAMRVAEARGVILYEAALANMKIFEASPPEIKMAITGHGRSDKNQMIKMVKMLVKLPQEKSSDDELDAIAIALTAFAHLR
jgi:crossover junction endodeoxyribonuclease RuvC